MRAAQLRPSWDPVTDVKGIATFIILVGLLLCDLTLPNDNPLDIFRYGAYAVGATLAIGFFVQTAQGFKILLQPDSVAIFTLYFLTYAEFLSPDLRVLRDTTPEGAIAASEVVMLSFAGLALGRHLPLFGKALAKIDLPEVSPAAIYRSLLLFAFLGYLYVLMSVQFDVTEIISSLLLPRFWQPWQRGRLGDWSSLLIELNLLLYAVFAIGGYIYASRRLFSMRQKIIVAVILLFSLFFDVASGARNIVMIRIGLFLMTYLLADRTRSTIKTIAVVTVSLAGLWIVTGYMLEFRNAGLGAFLDSTADESMLETHTMIDNNMYSIANVIEMFPKYYDYPGFQVIWTSVIHPIPRALWPDKPVDWSDSIEQALDSRGGTIAVTYVGEAYLVAGYATAFLFSLLFGALAAGWGKMGSRLRTNAGLILYVSGFYAVTLGMRSMQWITVAILPVVAFYLTARLLPRSRVQRIFARIKAATRTTR